MCIRYRSTVNINFFVAFLFSGWYIATLEQFKSCFQRLSSEISMFLKNLYLRKTLNRAGLLPKEKCFQISDVMRMFWKLWKLIFFILRKLETFPVKCRLPEWAPRDSFHSHVIVLVGSQETARTSRVATEKSALCKGSRVHRFEGQWKVGTSGQWEWHFLKSGKSKQFFCPLTFCSPSENLRQH